MTVPLMVAVTRVATLKADVARKAAQILVLALLTAVAPAVAVAQTYPSKPIKIISSYGPGGPNDVFSRLVAQKLSDRIGQQVIVENRAGADGRIGAEAVAKSAPDGYTLLMLALAHTAHPALYKLNYDVEKDFVPITRVASLPLMLVVNNNVQARTTGEFISLAKAKPGAINYASAGNGTSQHLAMEMFSSSLGLKMQHVPYKGLGPAFVDMMNGQVAAVMSPIASALPLVNGGKLRALGIATSTRFPLVPDVPTIAEAGIAGYQVDTWHGLVAPTGTPEEVLARLNKEIVAILQLPETRASFANLGALPVGNSPSDFAAEIKSETARWAKVIRDADIKGN